MLTKLMIALVSLSISLSAAAEKRPKRPAKPNPAQCIELAMKIATALDAVNDRSDSEDKVTTKSEVEYFDANMDYSKFLTYNFGDGESYLEVIIEADRYEKRECFFRSAQIQLQE